MLMPAAVLILLVLGAIAVDSASVHLAQRQLADAVSAAANDAAGSAIADSSFYQHGDVILDASRAASVAAEAFAAAWPAGRTGAIAAVSPPSVQVQDNQVCVSAQARVRHIFARAIPGVAHDTVVRARASATAARGTELLRRSGC